MTDPARCPRCEAPTLLLAEVEVYFNKEATSLPLRRCERHRCGGLLLGTLPGREVVA